MLDQKTLGAEDVARLLTVEEGHFLDLKREVTLGKLSESISAVASASQRWRVGRARV